MTLTLSYYNVFSLIPFAFLVIFTMKRLISSSENKEKKLPSPKRLPIIGNLHQLGQHPHRAIHLLSRKYGPLMLLHFGNKPTLVVSSASAASEIMKNHDLAFVNRPKSRVFHRLFYGARDVGFAPYGESWRQLKSICVLQLLSNKMVQSFRHVRAEETSLMIEKIKQKCLSSSSALINLTDVFMTLTNDIICRVSLGRKYGDEENGAKTKALLVEFIRLLAVFDVGDYIPWLSWVNRFNGLDARVERVVKQIDEFIEGVIEDHMSTKAASKSSGVDFVDILLKVQKEKLAGFAIEDESVKAVTLDMLAGGSDTTRIVMEWAMAELLRNPTMLKKLQNEVRNIAKGKSDVTEDDLDKMQYLKAVIKETLRLHSPLPLLLPRESTRDIEIMGYEISKDTQVIVNYWAIARDPALWNDPEEFQPDRFLNCGIDSLGLNFEFIPFGSGRRSCPGRSFAMAINELVLANLVHRFDFKLPDGTNAVDLDMSEVDGVVVHHRKLPLYAVAILNAD